MKNSIHKKIEKRIRSSAPGSVFVPSDFLDIASQTTASKCLCRFCEDGLLNHVMQGVFCLPDKNAYPHPDKVAHAIARSKAWRIAPCGDTALYLLGLSQSKPKKWTYVTNGSYRKYRLGSTQIEFNNTVARFIDDLSDPSALLVQVLKAYGKENVSDEILKRIKYYFEDAETTVINEIQNTTEWMTNAVIKMFSK